MRNVEQARIRLLPPRDRKRAPALLRVLANARLPNRRCGTVVAGNNSFEACVSASMMIAPSRSSTQFCGRSTWYEHGRREVDSLRHPPRSSRCVRNGSAAGRDSLKTNRTPPSKSSSRVTGLRSCSCTRSETNVGWRQASLTYDTRTRAVQIKGQEDKGPK